jgi:hypothetical protein
MPKPSDKVSKFNFNGMGHIYMNIDQYDKDMKAAAWYIRHALGSNHGFKPEACSGCAEVAQFLKDNPDGV